MAKHWKFQDGTVHCIGMLGGDFALCGAAPEGERGSDTMTETFEPIDCPDCEGVILFCQKVRPGEIRPRFQRRAR